MNQDQVTLNETLTREIKFLREQVDYLTNKLYGKSKESLPEQLSGQLSLDLFDDPIEPELPMEEEVTTIQTHQRKKTGNQRKENACVSYKRHSS